MNEKPDLQNKYIASDQKQPKNSQPGDSSERLAICSMVAGIVGVLCACCCFPSGLICGAIGIVMAIMSRNADIRPKKSFCTHAVIGLVLCAVAAALTFFVCYAMIAYYSAIREPEGNDFSAFFAACPRVARVLFNGAAAERLFFRLCGEALRGREAVRLPSTSPACTLPYARKLELWRKELLR